MIKFHPTEQHLVNYVTGDLTPAMLMMVGAHVDMCPVCQEHVRDIETELANKVLFASTPQIETSSADLDMLEQIMAQPPQAGSTTRTSLPSYEISLEGQRFKLPPTLGRTQQHIGDWQKMFGQLWRAPIQVGGDDVLTLLYMDKHTKVPEHTHKGREATLVLNGVFNDETSDYRDGDFMLLDDSVKHTPQTRDHDCLIISALDAPLQFTSGLSRLLNPFSSLFFK